MRREALLKAAVTLFVEGGSRAVTHRAVAAAAGLPAATTTYYFDTIDDLLRESLKHHIDRWLESMERLTDFDVLKVMDLVSAETTIRFASDVLSRRPPETAIRELSVILGAARDPQLRPTAMRALTKAVDVLVGALERAGIDRADELAEDMVAAIGGVALRRSAGVNTEAEEAVRIVRVLRNLAVGHLVDDEVATATLAAARDRAISGRSAESP